VKLARATPGPCPRESFPCTAVRPYRIDIAGPLSKHAISLHRLDVAFGCPRGRYDGSLEV
jgi:hypothetical protein